MAYATQSDLVTKFGEDRIVELSDRADPPAGEIDATVVAAALDDASAIIDSYIGKRYRLPVSPVPPLLRDVCTDLAFYKLCRTHYSDQTRAAYDDAMRILANISGGVQVLDISGSEPESAVAQVVYDGANRQFSRKKGDW